MASIAMAQNCDDADSTSTYKETIKLPPELSKFKNIYHIISAGDYIDRSTFSIDELISGTKKLQDGGFIKIENDRFKPSKKTDDYFDNELGKRKHVSIRTALAIFKKMLDVESN
ncbi:hypothetical protein EU528_08760 [Candidatus Thorarchaeota archaeon]|nr:MAG: hypothetical protein EU528_08760 [Candidatus Thorarchaeota archaeon]